MRWICSIALLGIALSSAMAAEPVTVENFARAETDTYIRGGMQATGVGVGQVFHNRDPITAENTTVIR